MGLKTETRIKNILNHLREDGRISQTKIAKKEGIVSSRVHALHKIIEKQYIQRYITLINYEHIKHPFRTISIIRKNNPLQEKQLQKHKEINNIHLLNNESILIESIHKTLEDQEEFSEIIKEEHKHIISQHNIIKVLAQEQWRAK